MPENNCRPPAPVVTRPRLTLLAVALATFMTYLDNNIVNVAMPAIQQDLQLTISGLEWVVSAYILVFASLLLAGGRLADVFGRKRLFLIGLGIFTVASLAAGLAGDVTTLITSRALQGLGAALVTPTTLAIISATFTQTRQRAAAVGIWSGVGALALAVGPLLGGAARPTCELGMDLLHQHPGRRRTFVLGASGHRRITPGRRTPPAGRPRPVDLRVRVVRPDLRADRGAESGLDLADHPDLFRIALALGIAFVRIEQGSSEPMVASLVPRTGVLRRPDRADDVGLRPVRHLLLHLAVPAERAGLLADQGRPGVPADGAADGRRSGDLRATLPSARRAPRGRPFAMVLMAAGIASVSLLSADATFLDLMPSFAIIGIGGGLTVPLTASVLDAMPRAEAGVASGIFNASREVSGLLGITVIGAILAARQCDAACRWVDAGRCVPRRIPDRRTDRSGPGRGRVRSPPTSGSVRTGPTRTPPSPAGHPRSWSWSRSGRDPKPA